jgi:hypothetical protein
MFKRIFATTEDSQTSLFSEAHDPPILLLLLLLNRLPPVITGGQGLKKHFSIFF